MRAAERAAELWGAEWQEEGGSARIRLPVTAGVRRGILAGRLWSQPANAGSQLILRIEESHYKLNWTAVLILLFGAFGGVCVALWPLSQMLMKLAPVGVLLVLAAWFLVASKLRTSGPDDFLELAAQIDPDWEGEEPDV